MSSSLAFGLCTALLAWLAPMVALGSEPWPSDELARLEDAVADGERDGEDLAAFRAPRPLSLAGSRASVYVALEGFGGLHRDGVRELGGLIVVQLPLASLGTRALPAGRPPPGAAASSSALLRGLDGAELVRAAVTPAAVAAVAAVAEDGRARPVVAAAPGESRVQVVTLDVARACVRAAWRAAGVADDDRMDGISSRARWSATLPELRLRVMRTIDESGRLSLTGEEVPRYTEVGAASNWLEARLTFRLDRLLFADEEIAVERLRAERADLRARTAGKALQALFEWQRALALANDGSLSVEEHRAAAGREIESGALLDVMTDGWFGRYRATLGEGRL